MKIDSLNELKSAFASWRRRKKHVREAMPEELLARARRAVQEHGLRAVTVATGVERGRLFRNAPAKAKARRHETSQALTRPQGSSRGPKFSRVELSAPAPNVRPLAEVETATGLKLRVFDATPEMLSLLSAACGLGGGR